MAIPRSNDNPFSPGVAIVPSVVAGRDDEIDAIEAIIARITGPRVSKRGALEQTPWPPLRITGPRGVGKTTLLKVAKRQAQQKGIRVVDNTVLSSLDAEGEIITDLMQAENWQESMSVWLDRHKNISSIGPTSISFQERIAHEEKNLRAALLSRLRRQPVLLLLDEAMHYNIAYFGVLLQKCLNLIGDNQPLAVIIAGTPSLDGILKKVDATFLRRFDKKYINLISTDAAQKALRGTFANAKPSVKVADDALELMVRSADNYPYFIQLVGATVWDAFKAFRQTEVDLPLVEKVGEALQEARTGYYQEVYGDIMDAKLLTSAGQIIAFIEEAGNQPLKPEQIVSKFLNANRNIDEDKASKIVNKLLDIGLIWFGKGDEVQAAIPSFFKYFKARQE